MLLFLVFKCVQTVGLFDITKLGKVDIYHCLSGFGRALWGLFDGLHDMYQYLFFFCFLYSYYYLLKCTNLHTEISFEGNVFLQANSGYAPEFAMVFETIELLVAIYKTL